MFGLRVRFAVYLILKFLFSCLFYGSLKAAVMIARVFDSTMNAFGDLLSHHLIAVLALNRKVGKFMFSHAPMLPPRTRMASLNLLGLLEISQEQGAIACF